MSSGELILMITLAACIFLMAYLLGFVIALLMKKKNEARKNEKDRAEATSLHFQKIEMENNYLKGVNDTITSRQKTKFLK